MDQQVDTRLFGTHVSTLRGLIKLTNIATATTTAAAAPPALPATQILDGLVVQPLRCSWGI